MLKRVLLAGLLTLGLAQPAFAQSDLFSADVFSGRIDLRVGSTDGEPSWVDGGFGKSRFGGDNTGDRQVDAEVADAILQWRPDFSWGVSGVFDAEYQSNLNNPVGFTEAYLLYKPLTSGGAHYQVRAGMFWPPVSLEHDGPAWTTTRTITPSAINSWISEETKATGLEASARRTFGMHELGVTVGAFESNDTAGALLAFRGWALGDVREMARGRQPLPPLSPFDSLIQPPYTTSSLELDNRVGFYVRGDWRPPAPVSFNAVHYDNEGDMTAVNHQKQWSWRTQFNDIGVAWKPSDTVEVLAQGLWGKTRMGYIGPAGLWVDVDYKAAYLLVSRTFGSDMLTGRIDSFSTDDNASPTYGENYETGWALTAAWRRTLTPHTQILLEATRIDSDRESRDLAGQAAKQVQTVIQASTRLSF